MGDRYDRNQRKVSAPRAAGPEAALRDHRLGPDGARASATTRARRWRSRSADAFVRWRWRKAYTEAWKNPPLSILKLRVARAEAAGVSYREYMLELLDTGRHLQAGDVAKKKRGKR